MCLLIANKEDLLFLGERNGPPGIWQLPQGGVEPGSSPEESALREASEELGAHPSLLSILTPLQATHRYDFQVTPEYAKERYRGQEQSFWLLRFHGSDSDIVLDKFHPEFQSFRWEPVAKVLDVVEPLRRAGYEAALREYGEWLQEPS